MYAHLKYLFSRRLVASALVGVLALGILASLPSREIEARPALDLGTMTGAARVIDGDTIVIAGRHIRLEGIDAPERGQTCGGSFAETWDCGTKAAEVLSALISHRPVTCESRGNDKYGRMLAICFVDGEDVNAEMVRAGYAWAFVRYSQSYVREEAQARAARVGIWQGDAEPAWLYRERRWAGAEHATPNGCAIKGNISAYGRIYYMPWNPRYGSVKIEVEKGERWFCSEAQATAAGWRAAITQ